jgi:2,3-dimethylmalate lyase
VEEAGFPVVYMTGFGTSAALPGRPDVGLLTVEGLERSVARARRYLAAGADALFIEAPAELAEVRRN